MEDFCREEGIVDEEEGSGDQEQQELEKRHCWAIITQFTEHTRPDISDGPGQYQHFLMSDLMDWVTNDGSKRGWDKKGQERACQNVKQWINDFDMFSVEGNNCWIEYCLEDN